MDNLSERHRDLRDAAALAAAEAGRCEGLVTDVLNRVVIETIRAYQNKVNIGIQDSVGDLLDTFKETVRHSIFEAAAGWKVTQREPFLFPKNCRFCFAKGDTTVVIIEQDPQTRSLLIDTKMLGEDVSTLGGGERIMLAMPYTVFVIQFVNGRYVTLYCGWRSAPLRTLTDSIYQPLLPNINDGMAVCFGQSDMPKAGTIAEQADHAVGTFWNSRFNNDLSKFWWAKKNIDSRLRTARSWNQKSIEDPTFILGVRLPTNPNKTIRQCLNLMTGNEQEPDVNAMKHRLSETIDGCAEQLFHKINRYFRDKKFEKHQPKSVEDALSAAMTEAAKGLADVIEEVREQVEAISKEVTGAMRPVNKVGPLWEDYSP